MWWMQGLVGDEVMTQPQNVVLAIILEFKSFIDRKEKGENVKREMVNVHPIQFSCSRNL
jgi:hypothetical protein